MDPLQIGEQALPVARPADLDDRLVALTGFSAVEHAELLGPRSTPGQIARVAALMLTGNDPPTIAALATMIAAGDVQGIRLQVLALIAPAPNGKD